MFRWTRRIVLFLSLVTLLSLLLAWPSARKTPLGIGYVNAGGFDFLGGGSPESPRYFYITVDAQSVNLGHWRDALAMARLQQRLYEGEVLRKKLEVSKSTYDYNRFKAAIDPFLVQIAEYESRALLGSQGVHTGSNLFEAGQLRNSFPSAKTQLLG